MARQMQLMIGGATVDTTKLGSIGFAKGVAEIEEDYKKGSDVEITIRGRVVGAKVTDRYDPHGNIAETVKVISVRADELVTHKLVDPDAYKAREESEDDAVSQHGIREGNAGRSTAGEPVPEPEPEPEPQPGGHLASV